MKEYKPKATAASCNIRYALMSMGAEAVCAYVMFKTVGEAVSPDRLSVLTLIFNIIAVTGMPLISLFADRVSNKHTGVRLGVLLMVLGYYYPVSFGIDPKVIILALGSCMFHSFAASSILSRSRAKSTGISIFLAGSALGFAFYVLSPFFCHILTVLLIICAIPDDCSEYEIAETSKENPAFSGKAAALVSAVVLTISYCLISYGFSSLSFEWNTFFKNQFLLIAAIGFGRAVGGIAADKLGRLFTVCAGAVGGSFLIVFCSDSKKLSLVGLALLSMPFGAMIASAFKRAKKHPAFIFSLFASAAYFGQELTFYFPIKSEKTLILTASGAVIAVAASELPDIIALFKKERRSER